MHSPICTVITSLTGYLFHSHTKVVTRHLEISSERSLTAISFSSFTSFEFFSNTSFQRHKAREHPLRGSQHLHCHQGIYGTFRFLKLNGSFQLVDFGLAKSVEGDGRMRTKCGTPAYTAPEMLTSSKEMKMPYTEKVDVWVKIWDLQKENTWKQTYGALGSNPKKNMIFVISDLDYP